MSMGMSMSYGVWHMEYGVWSIAISMNMAMSMNMYMIDKMNLKEIGFQKI